MNRALLLLFFLFWGLVCSSQEKTLLDKVLITDYEPFPFYHDITFELEDGTVQWKPRFSYMDEIAVHDITYLSDGLKIKGYMTSPKKPGKYPVIIFNRGGSFEFSSIDFPTIVYIMAELSKEGYVVLASQYRGNGGSEGSEEFGGNDVNDVLNLIKVAEELDNTDPTRIGMYGWSRGGMMTYLCLPKTDRIKAAVIGAAISDFRELEKDRPGFLDFIPAKEINKEAAMDRRSPILWADKFSKDVPILLLHGGSDWRVKPEHSLKMALEFEKHRIPYRLIMFEGADHGIKEFRKESKDEVSKWFDRYLKNDEPLPNMEYHGR